MPRKKMGSKLTETLLEQVRQSIRKTWVTEDTDHEGGTVSVLHRFGPNVLEQFELAAKAVLILNPVTVDNYAPTAQFEPGESVIDKQSFAVRAQGRAGVQRTLPPRHERIAEHETTPIQPSAFRQQSERLSG